MSRFETLLLPLIPHAYQDRAKAVIALLGAVLVAAAAVFVDVPALTVALALATALGVYAQPNTVDPDRYDAGEHPSLEDEGDALATARHLA